MAANRGKQARVRRPSSMAQGGNGGPNARAAKPRKPRRHVSSLALTVIVLLALVAAGFVAWRIARNGRLAGPGKIEAGTGSAAGFNVLLVTLDTVRPDHLGCYGSTVARTPNLDGLAASGLRFDQAIAPAPITVPSHATMLTGLEPPEHGARDNGFHLDPARTTLAEVLAEKGYSTAAFISSFILERRFGLNQGFATYDDLCANESQANQPGDPIINARNATSVTDAALKWLRGASVAGKPFFAWIHYFDAHFPYTPPPEFRQFANPYDGAIAYEDAQLGRILELLRLNGSCQRTLIVVASDHGEGLEEHDEPTHSYLVYDSTVRAALILNNPALFKTPRVIADRVVSLADIMPTVLDLLGVPPPGRMDGRHLLGAADPDRAVYIETMGTLLNNGWASLHGLRRLHDKYIMAPRPEYYDLSGDPHELNNLAPAASAAAAELERRLAELMARWETPQQVAARATALSADELERLASLGYLSAPGGGVPTAVLDPKDMMPLWRRVMSAEIKSLQGNHQEAVAEIEAALQQDPMDGHAWHYAGTIYKRCGQTDKAEAAVRREVALNPSAPAYTNLAQYVLLRGVRGEEFEALLQKAAQFDPHHGGIFIVRGERCILEGRAAEAITEFEQALRFDPTNFGRMAREKIQWVQTHM